MRNAPDAVLFEADDSVSACPQLRSKLRGDCSAGPLRMHDTYRCMICRFAFNSNRA